MAEVATVEAAMAAGVVAARAAVAEVVATRHHAVRTVAAAVAGRSLAAIVEAAETARGATEEVGTMAEAPVFTGKAVIIVVAAIDLTEAAGVMTAVRTQSIGRGAIIMPSGRITIAVTITALAGASGPVMSAATAATTCGEACRSGSMAVTTTATAIGSIAAPLRPAALIGGIAMTRAGTTIGDRGIL
jgi:hypothetical protein